jgi:hypothetical protein
MQVNLPMQNYLELKIPQSEIGIAGPLSTALYANGSKDASF